jgi:pimeloyl-ACP methyl ester carboxylesterase
MPHADVNGQRLFYEDHGSGEDVIVFSHGYLMDHSMFDAQVQGFEGDWRCIAWDERCFGETQSSDDPFDYWDSARDLLGLLDHLGIQRAVLAGMSQGGFLSLRAALLAPERVRALVLLDTRPEPEDPERVPGYDQLQEAWLSSPEPPQEVLDTVAAIILGPGFDRTPEWQAKWRKLDETRLQQAYTTLMTREDDVSPRVHELTMPALVVHGAEDLAIELPVARRFAGTLPQGQLAVIDGAGHAANLTHPEPVNAAIASFLSGV